MLIAKLAEDVPEYGLGAGAFVGGNIVHGAAHLSGPETTEVFAQFACVDADTLKPVTDWSQVAAIPTMTFYKRFGRRVD